MAIMDLALDAENAQTYTHSSIPLPAGLMTLSVGPIHWSLVSPPLPLISHSHKTTTKQTNTYMYKKQTNKHEFNTSSCRTDDIISGSDPLRLGQPSIASDLTQSQNNHKTNKHIHVQETNKQTWVQYLFLQNWWHYQWVRSTEAWSALHCLWYHTVTKLPNKNIQETNKQTWVQYLFLQTWWHYQWVRPTEAWSALHCLWYHTVTKTPIKQTKTYKKQTNKHEFNTSSCRPDDIISGSDPLRLGQPSIASDITQSQNSHKQTKHIQESYKQTHIVQYLFLQAWWHYQWVRSTEAWLALHCLWSHTESWWPLQPTSWGYAECGSSADNYPQLENGNQNLCIFLENSP